MFTFGGNFIVPLMSLIHHNDLSVNTSWRYLCNYRATEKIKVTFGDQIMSTQLSEASLEFWELLQFLTWIHSQIRIKQIHPKWKQGMHSRAQKSHEGLEHTTYTFWDWNISNLHVKIHLLENSWWCDVFSFKLVRKMSRTGGLFCLFSG